MIAKAFHTSHSEQRYTASTYVKINQTKARHFKEHNDKNRDTTYNSILSQYYIKTEKHNGARDDSFGTISCETTAGCRGGRMGAVDCKFRNICIQNSRLNLAKNKNNNSKCSVQFLIPISAQYDVLAMLICFVCLNKEDSTGVCSAICHSVCHDFCPSL